MEANVDCSDFQQFQEQLKNMRRIDDKIVYALNTSIPTESFKKNLSANQTCKELSEKLGIVYNDRNKFIRSCIASTADRVQELKQTKDNNPDDVNAYKSFKSESRKLRLMQSELSVEEIIKERTGKIFHDRCGLFFS